MDKIPISENHIIEFKKSSWNIDETVIRNRYIQENGRFDRVSSSELCFSDLLKLTLETLKRDYFSEGDCLEIIKELALSLDRQVGRKLKKTKEL